MSADTVPALLARATSADNDVKIDAIDKLQLQFEVGAEIPDVDAAISTLKSCLRLANQHLAVATVSTIHAFIPCLTASSQLSGTPDELLSASLAPSVVADNRTSNHLRQAILAFLPHGGVIDRLGEPRESSRAIARDTLVQLGLTALKYGTPQSTLRASRTERSEVPYSIFEKYFREVGFSSKVWRVREQSLLTLVQLRRSNFSFPLRPYVPLVVDALEDSDGSVRDCARQSAITLFSAAGGVSDGARTDLKNEMAKKNVRRGIVEGILSSLMTSASAGSSAPSSAFGDPSSGSDAGKAQSILAADPLASKSFERNATRPLPRGMNESHQQDGDGTPGSISLTAPTSTDVPAVFVASARDLDQEFHRIGPHFEGKETEHNWLHREQDIIRIRGMLKGEAHVRYHDAFVQGLRSGVLEQTFKALASLRTTLSSQAASLYADLAIAIGTSFDPLVEPVLQQLLRMAGFTKKIVAQQTQSAVSTLISHTSAQPRMLLGLLAHFIQDKNPATRQYTIEHICTFIKVHGVASRGNIESHGGVESMGSMIKKGLADANPTVKAKTREAYWIFHTVWPSQAKPIATALDAVALKQLDKAKPEGVASGLVIAGTSTPSSKKVSVASVIAASKAKARAIATAPPTLRHAATSGASAAAHRATVSTASSPTSTMGRTVGARTVTSPSPNPSNFQRRSVSPSPSPGTNGPSTTPSRTVSASSSLRTTSSSHRTIAGSPTPSPPASPTVELANRRKSYIPFAVTHNEVPRSSASPYTQPYLHQIPRISPPNFMKIHSRPNSHTQLDNIANDGHQRTASNSSLFHLQNHEKAEKSRQLAHTVPRESLVLDDVNADESLLMAIQNPLPGDFDDDEDDDDGMFAEPTTRLPTHQNSDRPGGAQHHTHPSPPLPPQSPPRSQSSVRTLFPGDSISQTGASQHKQCPTQAPHSPTNMSDVALLEDAIRANAEQAESSAERLTELLEPDHLSGYIDERARSGSDAVTIQLPPLHTPSLSNGGLDLQSVAENPMPPSEVLSPMLPSTPVPRTRNTITGRGLPSHLALFQASPAGKRSPSIMDRLYENKAESGWWLKRRSLLEAGTPTKPEDIGPEEELLLHISALKDGTAGVRTLQKLVLICNSNPAPAIDGDHTPTLRPSLNGHASSYSVWKEGRTFDTLMNALLPFLRTSKDEGVIEHGLCVIWETIENQTPFIDESEIFSLLFAVRYTNTHPVLEATSTIRDNLISRQEPVWCLKTLHGCLLNYLAEHVPQEHFTDPRALAHVRAGSHAFGIIGLGKLIMRLPPEIVEEELPLLKRTLTTVLDERDPSRTTVREAAYATIVAAQSVLRDETQLFELLDGLENSKKNLLTYYFDKHGARGTVEGVGAGNYSASTVQAQDGAGTDDEKVIKELLRLDAKISTPIKSVIP